MRPSRSRRFSATMKTFTKISRHLRAQNRLYRRHERVSTLFVETVVSSVTAEMKDFLLALNQVALHAEPDCAAAGTDRIADAGQVRIGIGLQRVGRREVLPKLGRTCGNFALSCCRLQTARAFLRKAFSQRCGTGGWVYDHAVLEIKREIPD